MMESRAKQYLKFSGAMKTKSNPDDLDKLLQEWVVKEPLPPRFQEQVWNRIRRAEAHAEPSFGSGFLRSVVAVFERPKLAYAYAAFLLAFGLAAGTWTAQVKSSHWESDLGQRYLQTVNPYQQDLAGR